MHLTALIDHKILWHTIAVIACGHHLLEHFDPLGRFAIFNSTQVGCALLFPAADIIKGCALGFDMGQIFTVKIGDRQFPEDIIQNRGRILDAVVALHHSSWLKSGEGESVHEFIERHAILQTDRDRDGEIIHHRAEARTLFVHINEDFAQLAILIFTSAQIDLMPANNRLLRIAPAPLRHFLAVGADHLFDHHFLHNFFGQNRCFFLRGTGGEHLFGFLIIFDKRSGQRLRQFGAIAIQCVGLDP